MMLTTTIIFSLIILTDEICLFIEPTRVFIVITIRFLSFTENITVNSLDIYTFNHNNLYNKGAEIASVIPYGIAQLGATSNLKYQLVPPD